MTAMTIIIIVEALSFFVLLFYIKWRFERKFFTAKVKQELEELVTAFNRQAERNIVLLEEGVKRTRVAMAELKTIMSSSKQLSAVEHSPVIAAKFSAARMSLAQLANVNINTSHPAKQQNLKKKFLTIETPKKSKQTPVQQPKKSAQTPEMTKATKLTKTISATKVTEAAKTVQAPQASTLKAKAAIQGTKRRPIASAAAQTATPASSLTQELLKRSAAAKTPEQLAKTLALSPNEVRLRLALERVESVEVNNSPERQQV